MLQGDIFCGSCVGRMVKQLTIFQQKWRSSNLKEKEDVQMGISKNSGTPKWMVYNEKPY